MFVAEDPIGIAAGPNGYAYVDGDPVSGADSLGLYNIDPSSVYQGSDPIPSTAPDPQDATRATPNSSIFPNPAQLAGPAQVIGVIVGVPVAGGVVVATAPEIAISIIRGYEYSFGQNWRLAPWGNRTANPYGRWPHYHRRGAPGADGMTPPGQGIGRHRPWEPSRHDACWIDRF